MKKLPGIHIDHKRNKICKNEGFLKPSLFQICQICLILTKNGSSGYHSDKTYLQKPHCITTENNISSNKHFLGPTCPKKGNYEPRPKQKIQNISFQFILLKYKFWLSYECFSILCDTFLLKRVFPAITAVPFHAYLKGYLC